jgi:hypothetical protein
MEALNAGEAQAGAEDSPLQSAVWLAQEMGIAMPPIPGMLAERLEDAGDGRVFYTDDTLLDIDSAGAIEEALGSGWPVSGLAFGYVERGISGLWFYTLVGARTMLHVSLRLRARPEEGDLTGTDAVTVAHEALERYLSHEANYAAATSTMAQAHETVRKVVAYSDLDGTPQEFQAQWSPAAGLGALTPRAEVFSAEAEPSPAMDRVIWA